MSRTVAALAFSVACLSVQVSRADVLTLRNGAVLKGNFAGGDTQKLIFVSPDGTREIPVADLKSLTFSNEPKAPPPIPPPVPLVQPAAPATAVPSQVSVPAGTRVLVRNIDPISSNDPEGKKIGLVLDSDLSVGGVVVAKAGAKLYGKIENAEQAGRVAGKSELSVGLLSIDIGGVQVPLVSDILSGSGQGSFRKTARRAVVGAAIGGAVGGRRGAKRGAGAGAATTLLTPGQAVNVAPKTLLEFTLEAPVVVPVK